MDRAVCGALWWARVRRGGHSGGWPAAVGGRAARTRVILFGSYARGDADRHSDLDFLVIEPSVDDVVKESARLRRVLTTLDVFVDVVVVSEEEAEGWRDVYGSVIHAALSEGRSLAA
jgi:uncharacterized protein